MSRVALVLAIVACSAVTTVARADEPEDDPVIIEAQKLYDEGIRLYDAKQFADAADRFARSYELSRAPGLLWNLAQSHRLAGDCGPALDAYRAYLRADPAAENAADARARVKEMKACVDRAAPPADPTPPDPMPDPVVEPPREPGRPTEPTSPPPRSPLVTIGVASLVAGAVLAGTGLFFAARAAARERELEDRFGGPGQWDEQADDLYAEGRASRNLSIGFVVAAGITIVAGGTLVVVGLRARPRTSDVAVVPVRGGATVGVSFAW